MQQAGGTFSALGNRMGDSGAGGGPEPEQERKEQLKCHQSDKL